MQVGGICGVVVHSLVLCGPAHLTHTAFITGVSGGVSTRLVAVTLDCGFLGLILLPVDFYVLYESGVANIG